MDIQTGIQSSYASNSNMMSGNGAVADNRSQNGRQNGQSTAMNAARQVDHSLSMTSKSQLVDHVMTKEVSLALSINNSSKAPAGPTGIRPKMPAGPTGMVQPAKPANDDPIVKTALQKIDENKAGNDSKESHDIAVKAVRRQVQQGFSQARSELNKIGAYDSKSEKQIAESETRVNLAISHTQKMKQPDAMDATARKNTEAAEKTQHHHHKRRDTRVGKEIATNQTRVNNSGNQNQPATVDAPATAKNSVASTTPQAGASRSHEVSGTMQLTTQEGDVVTIDLSRSRTQNIGVVAQDGSITATASQSRNSELGIKVDGDLNEQESQSIRNIVERVDQLASKMLNGNVNSALSKLGDMGFDYGSLSSMQLNMTSRYTSSGINAYNQVSELPSEQAVANPVAELPSHQAPVQTILRQAPVEVPEATQEPAQTTQVATPTASTTTPVANTDSSAVTANPGNSVSSTTVTSADTATGKEGRMVSEQSNSSSINIDLSSLFSEAFSLFSDGDSSGLFSNFAADLKLMFNTLVDEMVGETLNDGNFVESQPVEQGDTAKGAFNQLLDAVFGPEKTQDESPDQNVIEPQDDVQDQVTEDDSESSDTVTA